MASVRIRFPPATAGIVVATMLSFGGPAWAGDSIAAEALFREGRQLLKEGRAEEACPKFEASMQADPSVGAQLNLARCHALIGRVASAWAEYNEAAAIAHREGQTDRERGALAMAERLEPRLPRVTVQVAEASSGLEVLRDGEPMVAGSLGAALPIDPGEHVFEARAPGKEPWRSEISIAEGETKVLMVPPLEASDDVARPEPVSEADDSGDGLGPMTISGIVVSSVGAVALGIGIGLGVKASSDTSALEETCPDRVCPGAEAEAEAIRPLAHGSTATIVVGSAALVGGLVMILIGDDDEPESLSAPKLQPSFGPSTAGLSLSGRF